MATIIQEAPGLDTSGYDHSYDHINDLLSLPGIRLQELTPGVASQAFLQAEGQSLVFDHDTFAVALEAGHRYRLQITPEDPSVFSGNKIASVYGTDGSWDSILNATNNFIDGSLFSDTFTVGQSTSYYIALSMNTPLGLGMYPPSVTAPYTITVLDVTGGTTPTPPPAQPVLTQAEVEAVALLYGAALDRAPDNAGLNYWLDEVVAGQSIGDIANSFVNSAEFTSRFDVESNRGYIEQLYVNVLDRAPDEAGVLYWLDDMANGQVRSEVLVSFAASAENRENAVWLSGLRFDADSGDWLV